MDGEARTDGTPPGSSGQPAGSPAADTDGHADRIEDDPTPADTSASPRILAEPDAPAEQGTAPDQDAAAEPGTPQQVSTSTSGSVRARSWSRPVALAASTIVALVLGFALTVQI